MFIMANENEKAPVAGQAGEPAQKSRREFVKTSAQVAVTAPAVAMLLSSKPAHAVSAYEASQSHILDDFTFGNNEEDVDALNGRAGGGNFSNWNHTPVQDDVVPTPR